MRGAVRSLARAYRRLPAGKSKTASSFRPDRRGPAADPQGPWAARSVRTAAGLGQEQVRRYALGRREQRQHRTRGVSEDNRGTPTASMMARRSSSSPLRCLWRGVAEACADRDDRGNTLYASLGERGGQRTSRPPPSTGRFRRRPPVVRSGARYVIRVPSEDSGCWIR